MLTSASLGRLAEPFSGRVWAADETLARIGARIAEYERLGLARGDRVFLHYGNTPEFFVDLLAVWHLGACAVPVDGRLTAFEVGTLARSARPRFSVWDDSPESAIQSALASNDSRVIGKPGSPAPDSASVAQSSLAQSSLARSQLRLDDDALILFTSGTTGDPKGVVHTHRSLRARWSSLRAALGLSAYRRTLCLLPTHFGHGLICNCLFPWLSGQDLLLVPPFQPSVILRLAELIDAHGITFLSSVPSVWRLALKTARPPQSRSLVRIFCGSAPLSGALWQSIREWSGTQNVMNAYGITETGSWLAGTTVPFDRPEDGLIGEAWGGVIKVLRTADASASPAWAEPCPPGESGHVWVNTPALMKGYLDRDDLTSKVVTDGWFSTGDIGAVDERGYLYLRGREREEINKGGMKVYPGDVDSVIERFPHTLDVCTFAIPDPLLGEDVGVAVTLAATDEHTLIELHQWTGTHLAAHQLPRRWYVLAEIPRTSRGKVNRASVAAHCENLEPVAYAALLRRRR